MRVYSGFIVLTLLIGCSERKCLEAKYSFTTFEIGYSNGWTKGLAIRVDSNKIFFSPQSHDTIKYGLLPDSIFQLISKTLIRIVDDTAIRSNDVSCEDCSIIQVHAIAGKDTFTIRQMGDIDQIFLPVIKALESFIDRGNPSTIRAKLFLESQKIAFPPPLPLNINKRKFLPHKRKSGR